MTKGHDVMNTLRKLTTVTFGALLIVISSAACSASQRETPTTQATPASVVTTFPAPKGALTVASEFGRIHVHRKDSHTIVVQRNLTHVGLNASGPDWTLKGNTLDLGTGCGTGFVGFCEPSYDITVPTNMKVHFKDTSGEG